MSSINKNNEFVEFVKNNRRFFDPAFVANVEKGRYGKVQINSGDDHFDFDLRKSTVTVNRAEKHDIDNFNFNNLRLQFVEEEMFEGLLPVIRVTEVPQRKVPQAVSGAPKKSSDAEKWQKEVDRFLSKIMPSGEYKGCVSSFRLPIEGEIKEFEYNDVTKEFSVAKLGNSSSLQSKITSHPQGDLKILQGILNEAREGLEGVEKLRVKFSNHLETQHPSTKMTPRDNSGLSITDGKKNKGPKNFR